MLFQKKSKKKCFFFFNRYSRETAQVTVFRYKLFSFFKFLNVCPREFRISTIDITPHLFWYFVLHHQQLRVPHFPNRGRNLLEKEGLFCCFWARLLPPQAMGAAASVRPSLEPSAAPDNRQVEATPMTDLALHAVLRNLHLSPDTIDRSTAAIYAHVRDPVQHPVDKELARLCTSDYTRGALHALSWYLFAAASRQVGEGAALGGDTISVEATGLMSATRGSTGSSPVQSVQIRNAAAAVARDINNSRGDGQTKRRRRPIGGAEGGGGGGGGNTLADSVTGRLATMFNSMRRTRSMPTKEQGVIMIDDHNDDDDDLNKDDVDDERRSIEHPPIGRFSAAFPRGGEGATESRGASIPELSLNVAVVDDYHTPRPRRSNVPPGLRLGSPSGGSGARAATYYSPRRSPVKTGLWKLGHEIGKGSFGKVHVGLNENSGDLIAVKVLSLRNVDMAESLYQEVELMRQLTHPNIVSYLGAEVRRTGPNWGIYITSAQQRFIVREYHVMSYEV